MNSRAGITTIRRRRALMLAATLSVLLLPAADSQKPEELTVHVHVTCVGKYDLHKTDGKSRVDETDEITIEYEATSHNTAPPGTPLWQMSTETTDYHFTVSGSGTGSADDISLSWTWKLAHATTDFRGLMKDLAPGSFEVALPDFQNDAKVEPQVQLQSAGQSKNWLEADAKKAVVQMAIHPLADGAATMFDTPLSKQDYDAMGQFYDQLKGTFDQNAKSFSKAGTASRTSTNPLGMTSSIKVEYSLSFNQQPEDVEAILIPDEGYPDWMPEAGADESKPGNWMTAQVVLQKKGQEGKKPRAKAQFKFELVGTSQQPGVCLNWPPKDKAKTDFDLEIDKDHNSQLHVDPNSKGQRASSDSGLQESDVTVVSHDWGGWGTLKVTAVLDDEAHTEVVARLKEQPNKTALSIPKDDNGNHIADAWENDEAPPSTDAKSDDDDSPHTESPPGDGHTGDGLSLYEEYRGFRIQGSHERTHPTQKDVFIFDRDKLGRGSFGMSHLQVHFIKHEEFTYEQGDGPNPRVINFNSDYAHLGSEHVIEMLNGYAQGRLGVTEGGPDVPKNIHDVIIDKAYCMASWWKEKEVAQNIAHELGHATNVHHHGEDNYYVNSAGEHYISPKLCGGPMKGGGEVAVQGGQNSGAEECVMRYIRAAYFDQDQGGYCWRALDETGRLTGPLLRGEPYGRSQMPGTTFCNSNLGTGINSGRYTPGSARHVPNLGNATLGGCSLQFCVNDMKH